MSKNSYGYVNEMIESGWDVKILNSGTIRSSRPLRPIMVAQMSLIGTNITPWKRLQLTGLSQFLHDRKRIRRRIKHDPKDYPLLKMRAIPSISTSKNQAWKKVQYVVLFIGGPWDGEKKTLPQPCSMVVTEGNVSGYYRFYDWERDNQDERSIVGGLMLMRWLDHPRAVEFAKSTLSAENIDENTIVVVLETSKMENS